jgi:hypothetical protein
LKRFRIAIGWAGVRSRIPDTRRDDGRDQECVDGLPVHGTIAFMTRLISGAERIRPAVIKNAAKELQRIDICCLERVILTVSCPNDKHRAGYLTWADLSFY